MTDWFKRLRAFFERRFATQVIREAPVAQAIGIELPGEFPMAAYIAVSAT